MAAPPRYSRVALATVGVVGMGLLVSPSVAVSPSARYTDDDVVLGTVVHTRVTDHPARSRLVLQRKFPDRWRIVDGTARSTSHGFVLRVPTDQLGTIVVRVAARRHGAVVSTSRPRRVQVTTASPPIGRASQHAFSAHPVVRWDSCGSIRWVFNRAHAPASGLRQVRRAVGRVHAATGLSFVYAGRTTVPATAYGRHLHGADVVVGWRNHGYAPFRHAGTVGVGGNRFVTGYREADGTHVSRAVRGGIVLNAHQIGRLKNGFGHGYTWGEVIMHELGHVMGLAHTSARRQIMSPHVTRRSATWGAGDLAGLRRVGNRHGCLHLSAARSSGLEHAEPALSA